MTAVQRSSWRSGQLLRVTLEDGREFRFARRFSVGRGEDCDVRIDDPEISRKHVLVECRNGGWWFDDKSRNGVYRGEQRQPGGQIRGTVSLSLGVDGPTVTFEVLDAAAATRATARPA